MLIPISGLGKVTAIIVLTLYSESILSRTFTTGLKEIDPLMIEATFAMGMTSRQVFLKIQLPLAAHSIFSGIRLVLTSMIVIATIPATINVGGLGTILFEGLRIQSIVKMIWGTLATVVLCVFVAILLNSLEEFR
ncbi:ABC transporter permease [Enterococcus sp. AZ103]|uniref:ABC transporter permease n=1 Tax=Enterococcus sp. AZ103 TaxID=2774628 RepID=UPI003F6886D9